MEYELSVSARAESSAFNPSDSLRSAYRRTDQINAFGYIKYVVRTYKGFDDARTWRVDVFLSSKKMARTLPKLWFNGDECMSFVDEKIKEAEEDEH